MMKLTYFFLLLIVTLCILKRKMDFVSMGAISYCIYTIYCLIGYVEIPKRIGYYYSSEIVPELYIIIFSQLLICIVFMELSRKDIRVFKTNIKFFNQHLLSYQEKHCNMNKYAFMILILIAYGFILNNMNQIGWNSLSLNKRDIVGLDAFYGLGIFISLVVFSFALKNNHKFLLILSVGPIILSVIVGSRAYIATLLVIAFIQKGASVIKTIRQRFWLLVGGVILFFLLMLYKEIYQLVKKLDFAGIIRVLSSPNTYLNVMKLNEPQIVLSLFNYVIDNSFQLGLEESWARIVSVIPFANDMVPLSRSIRMSSIFKNDIFNSTYGLANNFWAECYAMAGCSGIFIFQFIWLSILKKGSECMRSTSAIQYFLVVFVGYTSFYIHRLDFVQVLGAFKSLLLIYILWYVISVVLANSFIVKSN